MLPILAPSKAGVVNLATVTLRLGGLPESLPEHSICNDAVFQKADDMWVPQNGSRNLS